MNNITNQKMEICAIHKSILSVIQTIYDVVKTHGGELKVEKMQGQESKFIIQIPTN